MAAVDPRTPMTLAQAADLAARLRAELHRVIIGQDGPVGEVLTALLAGGHCLVQGVPGLAKTLLVKTLGDAVAVTVNRIQFTPDLMPSDVLGTDVVDEDRASGSRRIRFEPGPIFANLVLADEINRTPPRTQAALLEAMQERQVTIGGARRPLPTPFFVMATENPIEQEGTYPLPEAQLDRFMLQVVMGYPDAADERRIVAETTTGAVRAAGQVATGDDLMRAQALVREIAAAPNVIDFATRLVRATRPGGDGQGPPIVQACVRWGAGPRAGQALVLAGKARAVLDGRPAVSLDDIRQVAAPVLRHRILVNFQAEADGIDAAAVVAQVLDHVPSPA
jgi:MoxR-like ATPase